MSTLVSPPPEQIAPPVRPVVTPPRRRWGGVEAGAARAAFFFLLPGMLVLGVFFFLPVAAAFVLSLTDFDIYAVADTGNARFVGFDNYLALFRSADFWQALGNTLYFVAAGGPLTVALSLGAALLVDVRGVRFRGLFRSVFFAPVVTTLVAVSVVWRFLYHTQYGLFNHALGLVGLGPVDWLGDPAWAMPAIVLVAVWKNFGYNMIIFIAGLQAIPAHLHEAAVVDGAGAWTRFRHVTLPMLAPTFLFVSIVTMIGYFQLFAEPYVMTDGGPLDSTLSVVLLMYREGFKWWNMGYAAALAFILFVLIFVVTLVQLRLQRGAEGVE